MSKDGQLSSPRGSGAAKMNPMFVGIVIGLLLGIALALGVALWIGASSTPYVDKAPRLEPLQPKIRPEAPAASTAAKDGSEKPRFDFYQILPGEKDAIAKKAPEAPTAAAEAKREPAKATEPTKGADSAASGEVWSIQAGAFHNETEAENLKAKIAFIGLEAQVKASSVADRGTLYRVRLGPYRTLDEVNRIKAVLSQNGISSAVVKPD